MNSKYLSDKKLGKNRACYCIATEIIDKKKKKAVNIKKNSKKMVSLIFSNDERPCYYIMLRARAILCPALYRNRFNEIR